MAQRHYRENLIKVLTLISLFKYVYPATMAYFLENPCPNNFQYQYDGNGMLYGLIKIECPDSNKVQLNIELSVGNMVQGYNGKIQLLYSKEKVIDDVMHRKPITYKVYFPMWNNIPPKITKILVNGDLICSGPKISLNLVSVLTTINLQHTLQVDAQPLASSDSSPTSNNVAVSSKDNIPDSSNIPKVTTPIKENRYNFNPPRPKIDPVIHYNPQPSKDPSKIYARNPFLNNLTTSNPAIGKDENSDDTHIQENPTIDVRLTEMPTSVAGRIDNFQISNTKNRHLSDTDNPYNSVCGRTVATNSLVVNGDVVPRGAYPWLVAMFGIRATGLNYMCSGTLISDKHVVTAAHCVKTETKKFKPQELLIILGKLNIQKWVPGNEEKMIEPESIHIHPDYESNSSDADIAVLVLSESVEFTKYIRPLCLWNGDTDLNDVVGKEGTVVGWGKDENGDLMTAEPKQTSLPIVSQEQCLRSSYQFQYITSNRTFCAGFRNGTGPCNGDSGSGFLIKKGDRWSLRGIVSMSISESNTRTCDLSHYVVFTDASKYIDWLLSFIK